MQISSKHVFSTVLSNFKCTYVWFFRSFFWSLNCSKWKHNLLMIYFVPTQIHDLSFYFSSFGTPLQLAYAIKENERMNVNKFNEKLFDDLIKSLKNSKVYYTFEAVKIAILFSNCFATYVFITLILCFIFFLLFWQGQ